MTGITSLQIQYDSVFPFLSVRALSREKYGDLPLPYLDELTVLGPYEKEMMTSVRRLLEEREGAIRTLTISAALEQEHPRLWESLVSLVPEFRVRDVCFRPEGISMI